MSPPPLTLAAALPIALCATLLMPAAAGAAPKASIVGRVPPSPLSAFTSGHAYRHGVVPTVGWTRANRAQIQQYSSTNLHYGGGVGGIGVTSGPERVYVVFWGSQWGSETTNTQGYKT
ncbi:MAG: hypothetical protein KGJ43_04255, partial [Acidobacteriota bacterium]|nr:hypothetical protein [Acidobacteriota bacterium]